MKKYLLRAITVIMVMLTLSGASALSSYAASVTYYQTVEDNIITRTGPASSYNTNTRTIARKGTVLRVVGQTTNSSGNKWYKLDNGYWVFCERVTKHNHYYIGGICNGLGCGYEYPLSQSPVSMTVRVTNSAGCKAWSRPYSNNSTHITTYKLGTDLTVTARVTNIGTDGKPDNLWYKLSNGYWIYSGNVGQVFTLSYNANGGSGAPAAQKFVSGSSVTVSSAVPKRSYYVFKGWSVKNDNKTVNYKGGSKFSEKANRTLYAVWSPCSHEYFGGICKKCNYTAPLKETSISGVFRVTNNDGAKGWSRPYSNNSTHKKTYTKGTDLRVIAKVTNVGTDGKPDNLWYKIEDGNWVYSGNLAERYMIKYNANGGTKTPSNQYFISGQSVKVTSSKPERVGYIFKGWSSSSNSTKVTYKAGSSYSGKSNLYLYAVWDKCGHSKYYGGICTSCKYEYKLKETEMSAVYRVTNGNGAPVWSRPYSTNSKQVKIYDKGADLSIVAKVKNINENGKADNTWYKLKDGTWVFSGNVAERFMVKYNANGGKNAPSNQYFVSGKSVTISSAKPTREKYVFKGWSTDSDSSKVKYKAGNKYDKDKNLYLYAVWEKCSHKYDDVGKCTVCKYTHPITVTKASGTVVVTEKDGAAVRNKPYQVGTKVKTAKYMEPLTIAGYAINAHTNKWYKLSDGNWIFAGNVATGHKVTYNANGGKKAPSSTGFVSGKLTVSSTVPQRDNYVFMGWSTDKNAKSASYRSGDTYSIKKDITLYAVWKNCSHNYKNNYGICKNCKADYPLVVTSTSNTVYEIDNRNGTYSYKRPYGKASEKVKKYSDESLIVVTGSAKNQYGETWYKLKNGNWIIKSDLEKKTTYNTMDDVAQKLFTVLKKTTACSWKTIDGVSYYSLSSKNGRVFIAKSAFTGSSKNTQLKNVNKKINQTLNSATNISTEQTFVYNRKKTINVPPTSSNKTHCSKSKKAHDHIQWEIYLLTVEAGISGGKTIVTKCTVDGIRCYDYCTAAATLDTNRSNTLQSKTSIRPVFSVGVTPTKDKKGISTGYYTDYHLTGKGKEEKSLTLDDYVDLTTGFIDVLDSAGKVATSVEPVSATVNIYKLAKSTWKFSTTANKLSASAEYKSAEHVWLNKLYYKDDPSKLLRIYEYDIKSPIKLQDEGDYLNMDIRTYNFNDSKQNISFSLSIK